MVPRLRELTAAGSETDTMKRIVSIISVLTLLLLGTVEVGKGALKVSAEPVAIGMKVTADSSDITAKLADNNASTLTTVKSGAAVNASFDEGASVLYIVFNDAPGEWTLTSGDKSVKAGTNGFLHEYIDLEKAFGEKVSSLSMSFGSQTVLCDISAFSSADTPSYVQKWDPPCEKADILLVSSHADDEQLFFAGILPYYAKVKGYAVQVAYATDHDTEKIRHHERLNGLWAVGIRNYPVSSKYPDLYSESVEGAVANLAPYGITEQKITDWETDLFKRFSPQAVVSHDPNGEYGHGMHRLVNKTLRAAVEAAKGSEYCPKKVYFHLYDTDPIVLDFLDTPFDELGGKTPFEMTQEGFRYHNSQHWTWFKGWIYGKDTPITKASQIKTYNPANYGLYYSSVGKDADANDIFENLVSYAETETAEKKRQEEEEARRLEEQKRIDEEQQAAAQKTAKNKRTAIMAASIGVAAAIAYLIIRAAAKNGRRRRRNRGGRRPRR